MIDQRDSVSALLELASQATTDGVRATALRRIEALADAELDRARCTANVAAMREALRPAVHSLAHHRVVVELLDARRTGGQRDRQPAHGCPDASMVDRFVRNALTLGVPRLRRSSRPADARDARCWRTLASAPPAEVDSLARDAGCLACAVLLRDLERARALRFLELLGEERAELGRLAQFVPPPDDGLARWTLELVTELGSQAHGDALATIGGALIRSLTAAMEPDVGAALQRRIGPPVLSTAPTPPEWHDAVRRLVEASNP